MIDFSFSWLPFIVIGLVNFFLSWLYYSPAAPWFRAWQIGVGMDPNKRQMSEADKKAMPRLMGGAAIASLLFSYGLQVAVHSIKASEFGTGVLVGVVIWLAFVVTHSLNTQFEGRTPVVLLINNCLYLVTYALGAGVVAVWR
jgi:UDP-N-acetylmuramyl pentapeptide phosphotransferase/UDP-N-acetylglucosamine-1-phosphate transferase